MMVLDLVCSRSGMVRWRRRVNGWGVGQRSRWTGLLLKTWGKWWWAGVWIGLGFEVGLGGVFYYLDFRSNISDWSVWFV